MLDSDEDRMRDRNEFPIEKYEEHLPHLRNKELRARAMTYGAAGASALELGLFAALPNHPIMAIICSGVFAFGAWCWSIALGDAKRQSRLIKAGGRPTGVWFKLQKEQKKGQLTAAKEELKGFADQVADIQAEAEKAAEDEKSQWWRQPGSLWHQTQEFIDETDQLFAAERKAEEQAKWDRLQAELQAERAEQEKKLAALAVERDRLRREEEAREVERETQRRIEATKRWMEQEREWDAFVEDAQMDARARKERGEFYEPPPGVPNALYEAKPTRAADDYVKKELAETMAKLNRSIADMILAPSRAMGGVVDDSVEVRAWGQAEPLYKFTPAPGLSKCAATGKVIYSAHQIEEILRQFRALGIPAGQYVSELCFGNSHYHLRSGR